jgi:hypothetical protein
MKELRFWLSRKQLKAEYSFEIDSLNNINTENIYETTASRIRFKGKGILSPPSGYQPPKSVEKFRDRLSNGETFFC